MKKQEEIKSVAILFAEWMERNLYTRFHGKWYNTSHPNEMPEMKSIEELFKMFTKEKGK